MAINYIPADVTQGLLFEEPQKIPQLPEGKLVAYDGENILPTAEGYKSFFGISNRIGDSTLPSTEIQEIVSFVTEFGQVILLGLCGDGLWVRAAEGDGTATVTETSTEYTVAFPLGKFSWTRVVPLASASPWKLWTKVLLNNRAFFYAKGLGHILEVESLGAGNLTIKKLEPTYIISAVAKQHKIQIELDLELGNSSYKSVQIDGSYFTKYVSREADVDDFVERILDAIGGGDISGKSLTVTQGKWNFDVPELLEAFSLSAELKAVDGTALPDVAALGQISVGAAFNPQTGKFSPWLSSVLNAYAYFTGQPLRGYFSSSISRSGSTDLSLDFNTIPARLVAPNGSVFEVYSTGMGSAGIQPESMPSLRAWLNANRTDEMVSLGIVIDNSLHDITVLVTSDLPILSAAWFRAHEIVSNFFTVAGSDVFGWFTVSVRTVRYNSTPLISYGDIGLYKFSFSYHPLTEFYERARFGGPRSGEVSPFDTGFINSIPKYMEASTETLILDLINPLLFGSDANLASFSLSQGSIYYDVVVTNNNIAFTRRSSTVIPALSSTLNISYPGYSASEDGYIYIDSQVESLVPDNYTPIIAGPGGMALSTYVEHGGLLHGITLSTVSRLTIDIQNSAPIINGISTYSATMKPGATFGLMYMPYDLAVDITQTIYGQTAAGGLSWSDTSGRRRGIKFDFLKTSSNAWSRANELLYSVISNLFGPASGNLNKTVIYNKLQMHIIPPLGSQAKVELSSFRHGGQKAANFNLLTQATETSPIETTSIPLPASLSTSQQIADHIYTGLHAIYPLTTVTKTADPEATLTATITKEFITYDGHTPVVAITKDGTETGDTISIISSTSQKMAEVDGIFKARGRLGAWKADGALHLSSPTNPMDFVPSISTQANELRIESIRGKIIQAIGSGEGFTLFNSGNVVRANYNGEQNSFNFAELYPVGIADPRHLGILGGVTYFYTPTGLMQSAGNEIQKLDYALLDYLAQFKIPLKISSAAERYLIIEITEEYLDNLFYDRLLRKGVAVSYPKAYQAPATSSSGILQPPAISLDKPYVKAFFFDTQLGKWGICTRAHKALISYAPWNVTSELISLGDNTYTAKLGAIGTDGKTYIFDEHSTDSYILFGKWGLTKRGLSRLTQVDVGFTELPKATVSIETSFEGSRIDFANVQTSQEITEETRETLHFFANGKWHNVKIAGVFELNFLNVGGFGYGR